MSTTTNYTYRYDAAGNRTSEQIGLAVEAAMHNRLNQLTALSDTGPIRFTGTLGEPASVTVNGVPAEVDGSNHFTADVVLDPGMHAVDVVATDGSSNTTTNTYDLTVASGSARALQYDANGNLTDDGNGRTFAWYANNQLASISENGDVTEFVYDGKGRRVQEKLNSTLIKQWVWCDDPQPYEERDDSDVVTKRFYAQGEQIGGDTYYFTKDHLGSIREMTDDMGMIQARYDYDPYGRLTKMSGSLEADFGFTGFYHHEVYGLDLTLYRVYDAALGIWLSRDPIEDRDGTSLYRYVGSNPINYADPDGRAAALALALPFAEGAAAVPVWGWIAGGVVLGGAAIYEGYQYYRAAHAEAAKPAGSCPIPRDIKGRPAEDIGKEMKDKGWVESPTREGDGAGTRYANPDKPGEQVRVMPGKATDPEPVKQGPYVRI